VRSGDQGVGIAEGVRCRDHASRTDSKIAGLMSNATPFLLRLSPIAGKLLTATFRSGTSWFRSAENSPSLTSAPPTSRSASWKRHSKARDAMPRSRNVRSVSASFFFSPRIDSVLSFTSSRRLPAEPGDRHGDAVLVLGETAASRRSPLELLQPARCHDRQSQTRWAARADGSTDRGAVPDRPTANAPVGHKLR
jgi:hypothetical protein